jgi:hypothetical protein
MKHYEEQLPEGYRLSYHIDARQTKTGIILTLFSIIPLIFWVVLCGVIYFLLNGTEISASFFEIYGQLLIYFVLFFVYMVLHELTHGAAYKALTGRKLKFGVSWSCAFCGVPDIFVYRRCAIIALIMPFAVFGVLFIALCAIALFTSPALYSIMALLLATHFSGCVGDFYMLLLFIFKYRGREVLMRDTGPEQFIYEKV